MDKGYVLDFKDIKQSKNSCQKLLDRGKKLISLEITNNSLDERSLNVMSVVIRAKKSLKSLKVDSFIHRWSGAAFKTLGKMKELKSMQHFECSFIQKKRQIQIHICRNIR